MTQRNDFVLFSSVDHMRTLTVLLPSDRWRSDGASQTQTQQRLLCPQRAPFSLIRMNCDSVAHGSIPEPKLQLDTPCCAARACVCCNPFLAASPDTATPSSVAIHALLAMGMPHDPAASPSCISARYTAPARFTCRAVIRGTFESPAIIQMVKMYHSAH